MNGSSRNDPVPGPSVRRLSLYLRQLEALQRSQQQTVSSRQLGESLGLTDAQVRKDLAYFGQFGHPGIGYKVADLISRVRKILGTDKPWNVVLVGVGNLGRALVAYQGFETKGFRLVGVFDRDPAKVGTTVGGLMVRPISELVEFCSTNSVRLGVIAVPGDEAQGVADLFADAGVRGLLNFAPVPLSVPQSVAVNAVDLAVQLEQLAFAVTLGASSNHLD
jgi:redox-sensing transcriptional repressor